jgi:hypothetical protein
MFYANGKYDLTRDSLKGYQMPTFDELRSIKKSAIGTRWAPVHHLDLVQAIERQARVMGYTLKDESFMSPTRNPHDLFGYMEFESDVPGYDGQIGQMLGFKSSNIQNHALRIVSGGRVFVCMNGIVAGEWVANHKHTTGLDLYGLVYTGLHAWEDQQKQVAQQIARLQNIGMDDRSASHALVTAAQEGILSSDKILSVYREWQDPKHPEAFADRNAWSFYNCVTERAKEWAPSRVETALSKLPEFLESSFGQKDLILN